MSRPPKSLPSLPSPTPAEPPAVLVGSGQRGDADRYWKSLTAEANAAFGRQRLVEAGALYGKALAEAERLFAAFAEGAPVTGADPAPMLVVSVANAAECALGDGRHAEAGALVSGMCRRLEAIVDDQRALPLVRHQCFVNLKPAVVEVMTKLPRAGWSDEAVAREAARAKASALRYIERHGPRH